MAENILLTFLSDVKVGNEISYENISGAPVHTTNESAVRYLQQNSVELSQIFILASKKIRSAIKDFEPPTTHLDYFERRVKKFLPAVEFTIYKYNEDGSGAENLRSVTETAKLIQDYARGKEIILHADLTGGMRNVNMMMLDIIRLLEYSGVKSGRLIYSNLGKRRVEELKDIYDLFQLISGVEEFINFGSVEALKKYYADIEQSANLKKLTAAMENFADSIKLCRYGEFIRAIRQLHDAINDFQTDSENVQDMLMARLIEKIREKYKNLIETRGENDLKIIRWCVDHGYLQQALTLYTERVPEYLGENFVRANVKVLREIDQKLKYDNRTRYFYLLNNYLADDEEFKAAQAEFTKNIEAANKKYLLNLKREAFRAIKNPAFNYDELRGKIFSQDTQEYFQDEGRLRAQLETLHKICKTPEILENPDAAELSPIKELLAQVAPKFETYEAPRRRLKEIFIFLNQANSDGLKEIFPAYDDNAQIFRLKYMLARGIFSVRMAADKFFSVMGKYFALKDARNSSNHAHSKGELTADELKSCMDGGLTEIETINPVEATLIEQAAEIERAEKIFINHTNHAAGSWSEAQILAAKKLGRIVDLEFSEVPPNFTAKEVRAMVLKNLSAILKLSPAAVLCQGEFNYTVAMVEELKKRKIPVLAATSARVVEEQLQPDGSSKKVSTFRFVNFRAY